MSCHPNIADPLILHHPKRMKSFLQKLWNQPPSPYPNNNKKLSIAHHSIKRMILNLKILLSFSTINISICYPCLQNYWSLCCHWFYRCIFFGTNTFYSSISKIYILSLISIIACMSNGYGPVIRVFTKIS